MIGIVQSKKTVDGLVRNTVGVVAVLGERHENPQ